MANEPTPTSPEDGENGAPAPKMLTEEQVNKIVQERLARDREAREKEAAAERQRIEDEKKSEVEKLASRISQLQKQLEEEKSARFKSELVALRTRIGKAAGLPDELVDLLQGDDEEALQAHAEKLKAVIGGTPEHTPKGKVPRQPTPDLKGGSDPTSPGVKPDAIKKVFDDFEL